MMGDQVVNQMASQLVHGALETSRLQKVLDTTFRQMSENPYWTFYEFEFKNGPFVGGELRLSKAGDKALLSLMAREEPAVMESDLDLSQWGEMRNLTVSPRIAPEGADAYVFNSEGVKVSFQFTHTSRRLRSVALEWGAAA